MIRVHVRSRPDRAHLQLAYTDPITGSVRTKSAGTTDVSQAQRAAAIWEEKLRQTNGQSAVSWETFRLRFENEHFPNLRKSSQENYCNALNKFERMIGRPRDIRLVNSSLISQYSAKLREAHKSQSTVATNLMILRSVLNWGASVGLIESPPKIRAPQITSRGRPISLLEFIQLLRNLKSVDQQNGDSLVRLAKVQWLGGLRISEAVRLAIGQGPVRVDFTGRRPAIAWSAGGQKSQRIERTPIAIDFARFLSRFPEGPVVNCPLAPKTIQKKFQVAGKGITSHDLRRSFGTRWALRVHPLVLKAMMRHATLETTLRYYVDLDVDNVSDRIWEGVHDDVQIARAKPVSSTPNQSK